MKKSKSRILLLLIFLLIGSEKIHAQIAVVVNANNPTDSLSMTQLHRIYVGEITRWKFSAENEPIILLDYRKITKTSKKFFMKATGLSHSRVRLKWLDKMLNGTFQKLPVKQASEKELLRFVSENNGAIGFVDATSLAPDVYPVKALKITGKSFSDQDYPFN